MADSKKIPIIDMNARTFNINGKLVPEWLGRHYEWETKQTGLTPPIRIKDPQESWEYRMAKMFHAAGNKDFNEVWEELNA